MKAHGRWALIAACAAAMATAGCPRCPSTHLALEDVLTQHNANAAAVERLWARAKIQVTLADADGRQFTWGSTHPLAAPNGLLVLFKGSDRLGPHDFVLVGREIAGVELFRVGSSTRQGVYYFWYRLGERAEAWWGRHRLAGAPGVRLIPIDPMQLLSVLGVCEMPDDLTRLPAVTMSIDTEPCAYVVSYIDRQPLSGRIALRREVLFRWSEGDPPRPFRVNFFAPDGRRVLAARLERYAPIAGAAHGQAAPVMPTDILIEPISWPGEEQANPVRRIHIVLSQMTVEERAEPDACLFEPPVAPDRRIQVDRAVDIEPGLTGQPEGAQP